MMLIFLSALFLLLSISDTLDTIPANQAITDGNTIVSDGEMFELGFFSPRKSKYRYLGIWYKKILIGTVVWVANRETPITDNLGMVKLSREGNLVILSGGNNVVWSSNSTAVSMRSNNPVVVVQLLDTGNLVVWDKSSMKQNLIWQSFDFPGNTLLPGMKFGKDLVTGRERYLTSWKSPDDPSRGHYLHRLDTNGYPQIFVRQGPVLLSRFGPWDGLKFRGMPMGSPNPIYSHEFVLNKNEIYHKYELKSSVVQRIVLMSDDNTVQLQWVNEIQDWVVDGNIAIDSCGRYGLCGPYGSCSINRYPLCICMEGFTPKFPDEWDTGNWSSGCQRNRVLDCRNFDGFRKISGVRLPDTRFSWYNTSMTVIECEITCRRNCSCTAYASLDIKNGGSGCLLWFEELVDTREYDEKKDLYIKMAASS